MIRYGCVGFVICLVMRFPITATQCCRSLASCYKRMLEDLHVQDEAKCIEDAAIGTSTLVVFLKALQHYCDDVIEVTVSNLVTYDMRTLYEVVINRVTGYEEIEVGKPIIVIDAGQDAGTETVRFALYIIEQLVACSENNEMIRRVKWVILPSTNPDGLEYSRYKVTSWKKNLRLSEDEVSFGVDISRNFDSHWSDCPPIESGFSPIYPGPYAFSENETSFIKGVLSRHSRDLKIYLTLRRDGHSIGYPYAYAQDSPKNIELMMKVAAEITSKVNIRSGSLHLFTNNSIHELEGKPHCGHSADYAHDLGIPLAYEMRVFLGTDNRIMSKFQTLPRGYEATLRNGYFTGIRELYNVVTNEKKYGIITQ